MWREGSDNFTVPNCLPAPYCLPSLSTADTPDVHMETPEKARKRLHQLSVQLKSSEQCVEFPGAAEKTIAYKQRMVWEISGYRCSGSILFTNFRAGLLPGKHVAGVTDLSLNLELPWGAVDWVRLLPKHVAVRRRHKRDYRDFRHDVIEIRCRDLRRVRISSLDESRLDWWELVEGLRKDACDSSLSLVACNYLGQTTGWWQPPWDEEFGRMGLEGWRETTINSDYRVCPSYPAAWWVPSSVSDETTLTASEFRSLGRCPVLTWSSSQRKCCLLRCAQPATGFSLLDHGWDTPAAQADRELLEAARLTAGSDARLVFFDCRTSAAAHAQCLAHGGKERVDWYQHVTSSGEIMEAELLELELGNIHAMRASWEAFATLIEGVCPEGDWMQKMSETRWMDYCRRITDAGLLVARILHMGAVAVVVHCSDGWDRTSQVCSLAQLLLDPHYRTCTGLITLIEKDWMRFGYKFRDRSGPGSSCAPIFLQWIFCVAAVQAQYPQHFEYNQEDLMLLVDLWMSGWTGTLTQNNEQERRCARDCEKHVSLWSVWLSSKSSGAAGAVALVRADSSHHSEQSEPNKPNTGSWHSTSVIQSETLLQPSTSLKYFELWSWALRFDEVVLKPKRADHWANLDGPPWPPAMVWRLPFSTSAACHHCQRDFSFLRWRHHCRACGQVFCNAPLCLSQVQIADLGYTLPVWCCSRCCRTRTRAIAGKKTSGKRFRAHLESTVLEHVVEERPPLATSVKQLTLGCINEPQERASWWSFGLKLLTMLVCCDGLFAASEKSS